MTRCRNDGRASQYRDTGMSATCPTHHSGCRLPVAGLLGGRLPWRAQRGVAAISRTSSASPACCGRRAHLATQTGRVLGPGQKGRSAVPPRFEEQDDGIMSTPSNAIVVGVSAEGSAAGGPNGGTSETAGTCAEAEAASRSRAKRRIPKGTGPARARGAVGAWDASETHAPDLRVGVSRPSAR